MTPTELQLTNVRAAIAEIERDGQAVRLEGRQVNAADLATLYARERELLTRLALERRGRSRISYVVPR